MDLLKEAALLCLLLIHSLCSANPITINAEETRATPTKEEYRLNNAVVPHHYDVELNLPFDFGTLGTFSGTVKISIKPTRENVDPISLHINSNILNLTENGFKLNEEKSTKNLIKNFTLKENVQMVTFELLPDENLRPALTYVLEIKFTGHLPQDMYGFYRSSYLDDDNVLQWIATTQFQPTHARRAFPCFDEPQYKATFKIVINHPAEYHAISNTAIESTANTIENGRTRTKTTFKETPKMSTYLIAFVVSKYVSLSHPVDDMRNSVWSPMETIGSAKYGLSIVPKLLDAMKDFTLIPYSISELGKIDQVSIPDFSAGAMENWGLVTYRETALLWDPNESSARNKQRVGTVIAHELAHMWFGNLVTLKWWSSTWLNEGFARYFEYHATAQVEKDWELDKQFVVEQHQVVMNSDSSLSSSVLTSDVYTPDEVSGKFGTITYSKGGSVIRMMAHFLGIDIFKSGIQGYLNKYRFDNTEPINLWNELHSIISQSNPLPNSKHLKDVMDSWTTKAGFPLVTVDIGENNQLVIRQEQFLFDSKEASTTFWDIPITYTTNIDKDFNDTRPKEWLITKTKTLKDFTWNAQTKWIILNIKASAYIRVNYHTTLWNGIKDALKTTDFDGIDSLNRAQIVDDAMNLARAGKLTYADALDIVFYLENEKDYYPWYPAFNAFSYLRRRIDSTSNLAKLLNKYISKIMKKFHDNARNSSSIQIGIHQHVLAQTWACLLDHNDCVNSAKEQFNNFRTNKISVDPDLRSIVYCTALRHSTDSNDWTFLWDHFVKTKTATEAAVIITALGCTKNEELLQKYLLKSIDNTNSIRSQDAQSVFTAVISGNPEGIDIGLQFLSEYHGAIATKYGGMNALTSVITGLADRLTTNNQITQFDKFVNDNRDELKEAALIADSAIQTAKNNLKWVENFKQDLEKYLEDKVGGDSDNDDDDPNNGPMTITVNYLTLVLSTVLIFIFSK